MKNRAAKIILQHFDGKLKRTDLRNLGDKLARLYSESKFHNHVRIIQEEIREGKTRRQVQ